MVFEYMIEAVQSIMSLMIIIGMMFAFVALHYEKRQRLVFRISVIAGVAAAAWMAWMKNFTNVIHTSALNLRIYYVTAAAFIAFIVFLIIDHNREKSAEKKGKTDKVIPLAVWPLSVYAFLFLFIILPDFIAYPYSLKVSETTVFSSSYILKLCGVILGFVIALVACFASNRMGKRLGKKGSTVFLLLMMIVNQVLQLGQMIASMITNHVIQSQHNLFQFAVYVLNHTDLFIYLTMGIAVAAAIVMLVRSTHVNEPYSNPAQHRKIRAKWRLTRKWAVTDIICAALAVVLMTGVNAVVNAEVELSPTEESTIVGDTVVVSLDDVSDGKLHRFGYTTENGVEVRYIVIQKPNSNLYGVGMDCCEICGETGYYQNKAGDVVCNRCGVIMNINTIGFKGGCNPKIVDYTLEDGQIVIPIDQLTQYEKDFSK